MHRQFNLHIFALSNNKQMIKQTIHKSKQNNKNKMEYAIIVPYLCNPKANLDELQIGQTISAPRKQRASILTTIQRVRDFYPNKKFRTKTVSDYEFTITRIR